PSFSSARACDSSCFAVVWARSAGIVREKKIRSRATLDGPDLMVRAVILRPDVRPGLIEGISRNESDIVAASWLFHDNIHQRAGTLQPSPTHRGRSLR